MPSSNAKAIENYFELKTDDLVLGRIKEIEQFKLIVSLPSSGSGKPIQGFIKIFDICDAYKKLLESLIEENEEQNVENVADLSSLFRVGQIVRCVIISINEAKTVINLSMNPKLLHKNLLRSNIKSRMSFHCAVSSIEDHGYVMDIGIKGVRAFLSHENAKQYLVKSTADKELSVGHIVPCRVKDCDAMELNDEDNRVLQLTADPSLIKDAILLDKTSVVFGSLLPGMWIKAKINKIKTGSLALVVRFQNYICNISRLHVYGSLNNYEVNQEVCVCILSTDPTHKTLTGSLLPHLAPSAQNFDTHLRAKIGAIYEDCQVQKIDKNSLWLWLPQINVKALIRRVMISDSKTVSENLSQHFSKESKVKCRIIDFDLMNNLAIAATKESVIAQTYLSYTDIQAGDIVQVEVMKFINDGILVSVTNKIQGIVPYIHLADAPVSKPQEKFTKGEKIKARVLQVDPASKKLILTLKSSLIKSKLPPIVNRQQLEEPGLVTIGFVALVQSHGLLISFYNNIKGWVTKDEMGIGDSDVVTECFYRGQVVKCRLLKYNSKTEKLHLSLKLEGKTNIGDAKAQKLMSLPVNVGQIFKSVIQTKEVDHFIVKLLIDKNECDSDVIARLNFINLSDSTENSALLAKTLNLGDDLEVLLIVKSSALIVSAKKSLIRASQCDELVTDFSQLVVGSQCLGWVQNKPDFGLFVEFPGGFRGLVPTKMITDGHPPYSSIALFDVGQTVEAKIVELQEEKRRCLLSLRMSSVYHAWKHLESASLQPVLDSLHERKILCNSDLFGQSIRKYKLGDIVNVKITSTNDLGILGELSDSSPMKKRIPCLAVTDNIAKTTTYEVNSQHEALHLYTDLSDSAATLELCLNPTVIRAVKEAAKHHHVKGNQVKVGQAIKSQVLLVKKSFIIVMLLDHAHGKLAYLPSRRHWNDCLQINKYVIGQINRVVVKKIIDDVIICNLKIHEPIGDANLTDIIQSVSTKDVELLAKIRSNPKIGDTLELVIRDVLDFQLNVYSKTHRKNGRVFISQVTDNLTERISPLAAFHKEQTIQAKLIAYREKKVIKQTEPQIFRSQLEFSLKSYTSLPSKYSLGDKFPIYFEKMHRPDHACSEGMFVINSSYSSKTRAVLNLLDTSIHAKEAKNFLDNLQVGAPILDARLYQIDGNRLCVTLLDYDSLQVGHIVCAQIYKIQYDRCLVRLPLNNSGYIHLFDLPWVEKSLSSSDNQKNDYPADTSVIMKKRTLGEYLTCRIIDIESENKTFVLTNRSAALRAPIDKINVHPIEEPKDDEFVNGYIFKKTLKRAFICVSRTISGFVDIPDPELADCFKEGKLIRVKLSSESSTNEALLRFDYEESFLSKTDILKAANRIGNPSSRENEHPMKKRKRVSDDNSKQSSKKPTTNKRKLTSETNEEDDAVLSSKIQKIDSTSKNKMSGKQLERRTDDDNAVVVGSSFKSLKSLVKEMNIVEGEPINEEIDLPAPDDDDDDSDAASSKPNSKGADNAKSERVISSIEEKRLLNRQTPSNVHEFDVAVKSNPNSSRLWTAYMAFHLQSGDLSKARAVGERSLMKIDAQCIQDHINIYVAMLNMEANYGSEVEFNSVFTRAAALNSPTIFGKAYGLQMKLGNSEKAEEIARQFVKRCSSKVESWILLARARFEAGKAKIARDTMQNALKTLKINQHVDFLIKMANLEFELGDVERGVKIFSEMTQTYPKRLDVHLALIQALLLAGREDQARLARDEALKSVKDKLRHRLEEIQI